MFKSGKRYVLFLIVVALPIIELHYAVWNLACLFGLYLIDFIYSWASGFLFFQGLLRRRSLGKTRIDIGTFCRTMVRYPFDIWDSFAKAL